MTTHTAHVADTMQAPYPPTATSAVDAPASSAAKVINVAPEPDTNTCECTAGWWMFGLGYILYLPWVAGILLALCGTAPRRNVQRNNERAAWFSFFMLVLSVIVIIILVVVVGGQHGWQLRSTGGALSLRG